MITLQNITKIKSDIAEKPLYVKFRTFQNSSLLVGTYNTRSSITLRSFQTKQYRYTITANSAKGIVSNQKRYRSIVTHLSSGNLKSRYVIQIVIEMLNTSKKFHLSNFICQ